MDFLEDFIMPLSNWHFQLCYNLYYHKMLVWLKNHLNYLKHNIFECFFNKYNRLLLKKVFFHNV